MRDRPSDLPIAMEERVHDAQRLHSPSAGRNKAVIAARLSEILPQKAIVLEIGSGTGEHAAAACAARPDIQWYPSDPDPASRLSQNAWAAAGTGQIQPSRDIDPSVAGWTGGLPRADAIVCCNVIHISPWQVAEGLAAGAADLLGPGGQVVLYGPFLQGDRTAPSNLDFDASLKARNPAWGVRELDRVTSLFATRGFLQDRVIEMPANNLLLVLRKQAV